MKIKPLTSLRFFFALMVFLRHTGSIFNHEQFSATKGEFATNLYNNFFAEGFVGVNFFFMLSGFILAFNYKNKLLSGKINHKEFWIARVARIYPLHLFTLLLAIPFSIKGMFAAKSFWLGKLLLNVFLLQSFVPAEDVYFSWNITAWSISDELFFYLLFPFIIIAFTRFSKWANGLAVLLLLLIPVGVFVLPVSLTYHLFYINPLFRLADFVIGIMLFNLYEKVSLHQFFPSKVVATAAEAGAILLFVVFFCFHQSIPEGYRYGAYYWLPVACIIFVFAQQAGYLSGLLSAKVLVIGGEISFSFYLLHHLVIRYLSYINAKLVFLHHAYQLILVIFIVSTAASYCCYKYIEIPANKYMKTRLRQLIPFRGKLRIA